MTKPLKALILEDSPNDILLLVRELKRGGFDLEHIVVSTADDMRAALREHAWDIILSDYSMGSFGAPAALQIVQDFGIDIPFIIISGTVGEDVAVEAMKAGASDFFSKGKLTRIVPAVERELREAAGRRKRVEAEARFTTAFHSSPVGTVISRLSDGRIIDVNERLLTTYNLTRESMIGKTNAELDIWVKPEQNEEIARQLQERGSVESLEIEYQNKAGRHGYALMSAEIIEIDNELCILSMIHDITDRKESETALRANEEKFRVLAENSTDMISRHTPTGEYLYVSPSCRALLGYEPEELIGHSAYEYFHPDDIDVITRSQQPIIENKSVATVAYRIRRKDGQYVWFETVSRTIRSEPFNEVLEIQAASRDISARKEDELALERYAERLELLHNIDLAILRADQPQSIAQSVLVRLQASMGFDCASITAFDLENNEYSVLAAIAPIPNYHPYDDQSIVALLQQNEMYYVGDLNAEIQSPSDQVFVAAGIRSYVRVPLVSSGKLLGSFSLFAKNPHAFLVQQLDIAKEVAAQLAIVIENARLLEVEQHRNSELAALHQASLQLTSSLDVEKVLATVIDYAILLINATAAHIFLYDGERLTFGAAQWNGQRQNTSFVEPKSDGVSYVVARSGQRFVVPDVNQYGPYKDAKWGGAIIGLPLRVADKVNGVMSLAFANPHHFDEHEIRVLELLADQAAIAIHNAQLYQQVRSHADELEQRVLDRTQQLQRAKDRVIAILNNSGDAVILTNSQGLIQQTNPAFNHQFRYEADVLFGQPLSALVAAKSIPLLYESLEAIDHNDQPNRIEVFARRKDNTTFPAEALISTFNEGDERMVVYSLRDISHQKRVEQELRVALENEKEVNELKTSFTSIVSHEFRTPLSVILTSSDFLIHYFDRLDQTRRLEKLQNISRQVGRLVRLMDDVLTITRAESVGFDFRPRRLNLAALSEEIISDVKVGYSQDVKLDFIWEGHCNSTIVDDFLFSHILQNLVSNAIKYSRDGGQVKIQLSCSDSGLQLSISDQGIGIPAQHQHKLFETFHRASNVGSIQGTGIGLTIVKRAVDAHGGTIEFTSVEGVGTTFVVRLPAVNAEDEGAHHAN